MPRFSAFRFPGLLAATLVLGGCDPRDCWLGISHGDCTADGTSPQDDAICQSYGLTPGTHDYAVGREKKRHVRALTEQETNNGALQDPLTPDVRVAAPAPVTPQ